MFFGAAVGGDTLWRDPPALASTGIEAGMVVSEGAFKWRALRPTPQTYDFTEADALVAWASSRGIAVRGHTLVWHQANPVWLETSLDPANAERLLTQHISTVTRHFAGKLAHWDVLNEAIASTAGQTLRPTPWLKALGPAYVNIAFHAAAAGDPHALRVLNDYGTDYDTRAADAKRAALLDVAASLIQRGVPIQAIGLQAHLNAAEIRLSQRKLSRFVADIAALGLKIVVTEFDVSDQDLPAEPAKRDAEVAAHARAWLDAVLPNPAVLGLLCWGLTDRHTWLNAYAPRADGLPQRPLPLDAVLNRKPLWASIAAALDAAPARASG
jgi:endo-1,4-beta-xylanase